MAKLWDSSEDAFCRVQAALDIHIAAAWTKELDAGLQTCQKPFILSICMTLMMMKKQLMELCMNQNQQHVLPLCIKAFNNFLQTTTHIVQHAQHLSCDDISSSTWPIWPSVGSCLSDIAYCRLQLTQTRSAMWVCPGQFQAPPDTSAWGWPTIWCCNTCTTCLPSAHTKTQMCTNCLESERCKFCHPIHMPTEENSQYR